MAVIQERTERAARQLARGQEQLVLLLLMAIVTYLLRGQMKAGIMGSMENIATRSAKLQADIANKQFGAWLAKNEAKLLAHPDLQIKGPTPVKKPEPLQPARQPEKASAPKPVAKPAVMSLREAVGNQTADRWISTGRRIADFTDPKRSALLTDDQIGALHGYTTNEGYQWINPALRGQTPLSPQMEAFVTHANEGLAKLPSYTLGDTFRGTTLPEDVMSRMQVGLPTSDAAFLSTSADRALAFNGNVKMTLQGVTGKDISFLSGHREAEVLFGPGTRFNVVDRVDNGSVTQFILKEIP